MQGLRLCASTLPDLSSAEQLVCKADSVVQELQSLFEVINKIAAEVSRSKALECLTMMEQLSQQLQDYRRFHYKTGGGRGGAALSMALERILKEDEGFLVTGLCARSLLDILAAWRSRFSYLVPQSLCHQLVTRFGSDKLLDALVTSIGSAATQQHPRGMEALESECVVSIRLTVEILRGASFSSAEKSQWLLHLAKTSKTLSNRGKSVGGGKTAMQDAMRDLATVPFDSGSSASAVMQQLLRDADSGEAVTAAVSASAILLRPEWDPELAAAVTASLPRAEAGHWFAELADVYTSCLRSFFHEGGTSQMLQLLRLPYMPAAVKAKQLGFLVGHILNTGVRSELELDPAAVLELLRLSSSYGIKVAVGTCEEVLSRCIGTKQLDLVIPAMTLFFNEFATAMPGLSLLRGLVSVPAAQPSVFMPLCDPARRGTFSALLLRIGAAERSPSWALAAAREAATLDISVPPDVVSELAEAFLPPHIQHSEFVAATDSGGEDDGAKATLLAFTLMLEAHNTPTGQYRSPADPDDDDSEPRGFGSNGRMQGWVANTSARQKPDRPKQTAVVGKGRKGGLRSLSAVAHSRIARHLLTSSDPDLLRFRPLALGMAPSQEAAAQLLSYQPLPGSAFPSGFVSKVLELATDKANESWRDLGAPALSALRQLPRDQRVSELSSGGAAALCQLLIRDAFPPAANPPPLDRSGSLHLLLKFLTEFSSSDDEPSAQLLTPQEWRDLVLQLLALGDGQQWDRASPLLAQVMQVLGLAAEAGGTGKQLAEKVWIVQQVSTLLSASRHPGEVEFRALPSPPSRM